jgi:hypothetical protein
MKVLGFPQKEITSLELIGELSRIIELKNKEIEDLQTMILERDLEINRLERLME